MLTEDFHNKIIHGQEQCEQAAVSDSIKFSFHPVAGKHIMLLENGLYARRIDADNMGSHAVVYGSEPITFRGRCTFEVVITDYDDDKGWRYSIRIGITRQPTGTKLNQSDIPRWSNIGDNHCIWCGDIVHSHLGEDYIKNGYGSANLDNLKKGKYSGQIFVSIVHANGEFLVHICI